MRSGDLPPIGIRDALTRLLFGFGVTSGLEGRLRPAASNYRCGRDYEFENISTVITPELAYTAEIERLRTRVGGSDELTPIAIRATTVLAARTARGR